MKRSFDRNIHKGVVMAMNWTPKNHELKRERAKELGLKHVEKYAGSVYSADGENGPYFEFDLYKFDFVEVE